MEWYDLVGGVLSIVLILLLALASLVKRSDRVMSVLISIFFIVLGVGLAWTCRYGVTWR